MRFALLHRTFRTAGMRISVQGTSGSGKTTLARGLAARLGLPHIELDAINWQPGWRGLNEDDPAQFAVRVGRALAADAWVCDGNYGTAVGALLLARATDVVILDYDRAVVMRRVIWRSVSRWLGRIELWPGTGNREDVRMWLDPGHPIRWAWDTHARRRARFAAMVADPALTHIRFHRLTRPAEAKALIRRLGATYGSSTTSAGSKRSASPWLT
jgi:adenylate kinase family enzyme